MALIKGKQLENASIAGAKLVNATVDTAQLAADAVDNTILDLGDTFNFKTGGGNVKVADAPADGDSAVNRTYIDTQDAKGSVRVATAATLPANTRTGNILTADADGALNDVGIDGVLTLAVGNRVLVKTEGTGANNGLYSITSLGGASAKWTMERTTDADTSAKVTMGLHVFVAEGTANGGKGFVLTTADPITLNNNALTFVQFTDSAAMTAGNGINITTGVISAVADSSGSATVGAGGIKAAVPTKADKKLTPAAGAGNYQTTTNTITATPAGDGMVDVLVNGVQYELGDGVRTKDCYFSADAGANARAIAAIVATDVLYWNGTISGFDLEVTDRIDLNYNVIV